MINLEESHIKNSVADSNIIFKRGLSLYEYGSYSCTKANPEEGVFEYEVDGNYGDYVTAVSLKNGNIAYSCNCPYPGPGCKHVVAVMLDVVERLQGWKEPARIEPEIPASYLSEEEIRQKALKDRKERARREQFNIMAGDMIKGDHLLETLNGRQYRVTLHDPAEMAGHCSCPDFNTNQLGICKHIIALSGHLLNKKNLQKARTELFPFIDVYWDSTCNAPRMFCQRPQEEIEVLQPILNKFFDGQGLFRGKDLGRMLDFLLSVDGFKQVQVREEVLSRVQEYQLNLEVEQLSREKLPDLSRLRTTLYPYQEDGVRFGLYRKAALIGDEMGLGKTLQAITLGMLKKEIFGFKRILVVTLASLKEQWKREVEKFTDEKAVVVAGSPKMRQDTYFHDPALFKITNYEAVLRDGHTLSRFKPDFIILDEAQRIKNFATKTADAVKALPRKHALVLTGTPLENKLEDVYSIVQFLEPHMLAPLWRFAADHFMLCRDKKDKILGYRNLNLLHDKLKSLVIRRRKEEVLKDLPEQLTNTYYLELSHEQAKIHGSFMSNLLLLLNKKFLTPMDLRRIQILLLQMRMVCDCTYLVDRKTRISPKLKELENILDELVIQSGRKMVIFSEWTTMTYLIAKQLSRMGINFVELSGKIPVNKRQGLIDEFTINPDCKVFLSTDSGGTGLNLQAADCVLNFELPWNPARLNQRIGRVHRIGQASSSVNVINLVSKDSIEEKILAGIQLKTELFNGVFDGGADIVEFSREKRNQMLNQLRAMMGEELDQDLDDYEKRTSEEIPEDTPHFLNPQALADKDDTPEDGEYLRARDLEQAETATAQGQPGSGQSSEPDAQSQTPAQPEHSHEKMETVLNQGMEFLSGILEMATGQKLAGSQESKPMLKVDKETGEVTMKFKLPGF